MLSCVLDVHAEGPVHSPLFRAQLAGRRVQFASVQGPSGVDRTIPGHGWLLVKPKDQRIEPCYLTLAQLIRRLTKPTLHGSTDQAAAVHGTAAEPACCGVLLHVGRP